MVIARQHRNRVLAAELEPARQKGAGFAHRAIEDLEICTIFEKEKIASNVFIIGVQRHEPIRLLWGLATSKCLHIQCNTDRSTYTENFRRDLLITD